MVNIIFEKIECLMLQASLKLKNTVFLMLLQIQPPNSMC